MNQYQLYVMPTTGENIDIASGERFSRITLQYILIYSDKEQKANAIPVNGVDLKRLTEADIQWVNDCLVMLFAEAIKKHPKDLKSSLENKIKALENALKAEAEKLQKEDNSVATDEESDK